jgi:23S rRNA (guanosine2251-2'-O)-methyltransferase
MKLVLVAHNIRSAHNVGSLLRTADGLGVDKVFLTGYSPYPQSDDDARMPHLRRKISLQIHKTALGSELFVPWEYQENIFSCLKQLSEEGFMPVALEQTAKAIPIEKFKASKKVALIVGNEVSGLDKDVLKEVDQHIKIQMKGSKESFNVAIAAAIALYQLRAGHIDKSAV